MYGSIGYNLLRTVVQSATSSFSYVIANQLFKPNYRSNYRQKNDRHYENMSRNNASKTVSHSKIQKPDVEGTSFLPTTFVSSKQELIQKPVVKKRIVHQNFSQKEILNTKSEIAKRLFEKNHSTQGEN